MNKNNYNVSVDCVIYGYDLNTLNIIVLERVLTSRNKKIIIDDIKLPGNHLYEHEDLNKAASRIVIDLTGLNNVELHQFKAFGSPNRISKKKDLIWFDHIGYPVTRVFTVAYYSLLSPGKIHDHLKKKEHARWQPVYEIEDMAYDHKEIVDESLKALRLKINLQPDIIFKLMPEKFTISQLLKLFEEIFQVKLDRRNFYKKINSLKYIVRLNEKQMDVIHKPGRLYMFDREIHEKLQRERSIIKPVTDN